MRRKCNALVQEHYTLDIDHNHNFASASSSNPMMVRNISFSYINWNKNQFKFVDLKYELSIFFIVNGVQRRPTLNQPLTWELKLKEKTKIADELIDGEGKKYSLFKDDKYVWNWKCSFPNCNAKVKVSYELVSDHEVNVHKERKKRNVSIRTRQCAKNDSTKTGLARKRQKTNPSPDLNNGAKD